MNTDPAIAPKLYSESFYLGQRPDSVKSAEIIVPWIMELVAPASVVDVGCGTGIWLSIFRKCGVNDVVGVDGNWVPLDNLEIPQENFRAVDMEEPTGIDRQFDLVVSLEVAEHLRPAAAEGFVSYLTSLGPLVFFSAAIPDQGGTGHLNEQWPDYWAALFQKNGYVCIDCLRGRFWSNSDIAPWYIQNGFFYAREDQLERYSNLLEQESQISFGKKPVIHPSIYQSMARAVERLSDAKSYSIKEFVKAFPALFRRAIVLRLKTLC